MTVSLKDKLEALGAVKDDMAERISNVFRKRLNPSGEALTPIERIEVDMPPLLAPSEWVNAQTTNEKFFWSERQFDKQVAGVGVAYKVVCHNKSETPDVIDRLQKLAAQNHHQVRFYGGICFPASEMTSPEWQAFGVCRFILPQFELISRQHHLTFACNLYFTNQTELRRYRDSVLEALQALSFPGAPEAGDIPAVVSRTDTPDFASWSSQLASIGARLASSPLNKVVLARRVTLTLERSVNPFVFLKSLLQKEPSTFVYAFQVENGQVFCGASPECLYRRQQDVIQTEAIAGTRGRNTDPKADKALADELLGSAKDREEHGYVTEMLQERLQHCCGIVQNSPDVSILKLASVQHLIYSFEGVLNSDVSDAQLIRQLFPTPAVAGFPIKDSLAIIKETEAFDRGWYTGVVGWISADMSEFAVAIRSSLTNGSKMYLFSGAGIVSGSNAESEWQELEQKIQTFLRFFKR